MKRFLKLVICASCSLAPVFCADDSKSSAPETGPYHVLKTEILGGDGSWDYITLDCEARRAYLSRETRVIVVDMETLKPIKEILGTDGVHGIAIAPEFNRGFTSNGRSDTVTIFDLKTLEKTGEAKAGPKPDAIIYDPATKRTFVMNNGGTTATAINAATGETVGNVELGGAPEFAVSDGNGRIFVNLEDISEVVAVDAQKLTVLNRWPLTPGKTPTGLTMDLEHHRLFSGCRGNKALEVMDSDNGMVLASPPIGTGVDAAAFDPLTQNAFASNGDGTLTVIHEDAPDKFSVVQNVVTRLGR